jgi:hypothetical protein
MFKKFLDKHGVWNPEVECGEVRDHLAQVFPNWRFKTQAEKGNGFFIIEGRKGILRMSVSRLKSGRFMVSKDVSLKWWILTLGVAGAIGEFTGMSWQHKFMAELKRRFAIDKNAPQGGL